MQPIDVLFIVGLLIIGAVTLLSIAIVKRGEHRGQAMNETERQIVAWLRKEASTTAAPDEASALEYAANCIQRGQHRESDDA